MRSRAQSDCTLRQKDDKNKSWSRRAPHTQLWWQREDNGQRGGKKDSLRWPWVDCHSAARSIFHTVRLLVPWRRVSSVYSAKKNTLSSLLQSFGAAADQFVTFKYAWRALVREIGGCVFFQASCVTNLTLCTPITNLHGLREQCVASSA